MNSLKNHNKKASRCGLAFLYGLKGYVEPNLDDIRISFDFLGFGDSFL